VRLCRRQPDQSIVRRHRSRRRSGNALLDLAFVLPILLMLTFGAVEYGYALYVKHALQGAAREGARAAIVAGATPAQVQASVDSAMQVAGFPQAKYTRPATITPTNWVSSAAGTAVTVEVKATWSTVGVQVLPQVMGGINPAKQLKSATTMRKEG
jgi:Flp pilus assembly protein TadG